MATPDVPPALRRAALYLHSLSAESRRQVLEQLGEAVASRLRPMLDELVELGIPSRLGRTVAREALLVESQATPSGIGLAATATAAADSQSPLNQVAALEPWQILRALAPCAPETVGALLHSHEWPWKSEVMQRAAGGLQTQVKPLAPAALRAACEQVLGSVAGESVVGRAEQAIPTGLGARVRRILTWTR